MKSSGGGGSAVSALRPRGVEGDGMEESGVLVPSVDSGQEQEGEWELTERMVSPGETMGGDEVDEAWDELDGVDDAEVDAGD